VPTIYYEAHPTMQRAIKAVVMVLDRGGQPPEGMDIQPAFDFHFVDYEEWDEGETPQLYLTEKGAEAAIRWRGGDDSHGGAAG
jgi:hypothetical protein